MRSCSPLQGILTSTLLAMAFGCSGAEVMGSGGVDAGTPSNNSPPPITKVSPDAGPVLAEEVCDGLDNNQDGEVDEGCGCELHAEQPCFLGDPSNQGVGACHLGTQSCIAGDEFSRWEVCKGSGSPVTEVCDNEIDDDCNGLVDDTDACNPPPMIVVVDVSFNGDCLTASCPSEAPYPVACNIEFDGDDGRGCVASTPSNSAVYFQEGNDCGSGAVMGTLSCSSEVGAALDAVNCNMAKQTEIYVTDENECPD